ncbi:MAG: discoidin domain-containing protein [Verrucomicrobia bacterium]|nr:MAG: discoidin domain-containing protein [Verrucomicrobiota bacterium]
MQKITRLFLGATLAVALLITARAADDQKVPLKTELPKPMLAGTPKPITLPNLEPELTGKRPDFMIPAGCSNLASNKTVTASDKEPVVGELTLITDGDKSAEEGSYVELAAGKQWVQIDLGQSSEIYAILVWRFHSQKRVYHDAVVQISDDPAFAKEVKTVYNTDTDNSLGLGVGKDPGVIENYQGKLIDAKGVKGRYVRLWSNGNTSNNMNHYTEVEVWGRAAK